MEVRGELHAAVALPRGNSFRFPTLGRFQGRSGDVEKSLLSPPIIQTYDSVSRQDYTASNGRSIDGQRIEKSAKKIRGVPI